MKKIGYISNKKDYDYFIKDYSFGNIEWVFIEYQTNELRTLESVRGIYLDGYIVSPTVRNGISINLIVEGVKSRVRL